MRKLALLSSCCLALLGPLAACSPPAFASRSQLTYFEAPRDLLGSAATRAHTEAQLQSLGIHALRIVLYWHDVAPSPDARQQPKFDPTDPGAYDWGAYDALINDAHRLGWSVLLDVSGPVPRWATAGARDTVTRPDDRQFEYFMEAVGRHYAALVSLWSIWNEPNHPQFLGPQFVKGVPASPLIYRGLWESGYAGLRAAGLKSPKVLMGETAPTGSPHDVAPLIFLRGALCLSTTYRRASTCAALPAYGYAHHAYTVKLGPNYVDPAPNDVMIGTIGRLVTALNRAARAGAIRTKMPIYLTEFGIQSKPNPFLGVSLPTQAEFDAMAERIAYENPRIVSFSQYLMRDDVCVSRPGAAANGLGCTGFQTGLELANGTPKPLYNGFRLPLVVTHTHGGYSLWGLVRPTKKATSVTVFVQRRGSSRYSKLASVHTNSLGYWTLKSSRPGKRWSVHWLAPGGVTYEGPAIPAS
jgi:hypothetical protein